ncbi:hypothetical protein COY07_00890 [Candidatus Peregrinibacteria bacterium CG_4_10_14_0_2_um_filter_43_11]|nr:MAG: hypothetical protein COY07_00890 [Candidatus Peregrinibacteria bacterium CG_4_10_14_0_2_um_filter_43_11]
MSDSPLITTEVLNDHTVIARPVGEIDASNLPEMENILMPLIQNTALIDFVLDCENLTFIDSKVVGYMAYLHTTLARKNRRLLLVAANESVSDIFSLVGLTEIIPYFDSTDLALNSLKTISA